MYRALASLLLLGLLCGGCEEKNRELAARVSRRMDLEGRLEERRRYFVELGEREKKARDAIGPAATQGAQVRHRLTQHLAAAEYLSRTDASLLLPSLDPERLLAARRVRDLATGFEKLNAAKAAVTVETSLRECRCASSADDDEEEDLPGAYDDDGGCVPWDEGVASEEECTSYDAYVEVAPEFECGVQIAHPGAPTSVFCAAEVYYPPSGPWWDSPHSVDDVETERAIVRIAFAHQGEIYVSDYPAPDYDLFSVPEYDQIESCMYEAESASCEHQCGGGEDCEPEGCGCGGHDDDYYDLYDCEGYDCPDFNPELAAARERVEEARGELAEAEEELAYQECLESCLPEDPYAVDEAICADETEDGEAMTREGIPCVDTDDGLLPVDMIPSRAKVNLRLARSPVAGVYVVREAIHHYTPYEDERPQLIAANTKILIDTNLQILRSEGAKALRRRRSLPDGALRALAIFADVETPLTTDEAGGKILEWIEVGKKKPPVLVIRPVEAPPTVFRFPTVADEAPVVRVEGEELCELAERHAGAEAMVQACAAARDTGTTAEAATGGAGGGGSTTGGNGGSGGVE